MKAKILASVLALALVVSFGMSNMNADAGGSGEKGTVVGTAVELSTYAIKGVGADRIDEMQSRADQGFPVGIIEEGSGDLWVCVYRNSAPASGLETANEQMRELLGQQVVVQGMKYKSSGVNLVRFSIIAEY